MNQRMSRFYDQIVRPAYYHALRFARLMLFPLLAGGGLAFAGREVVDLPLAGQILLWSIGFVVGLAAWAAEYLGDSEKAG